MKRILSLALALLLAMSGMALAEEYESNYYEEMTVVNCQDYVSLRAEPSTSSDRLAKVALGERVYDCMRYNDQFFLCQYDGEYGYILTEYLEPVPEDESDNLVLNATLEGYHVTAERSYNGEGEILRIVCEDDAGEQLWTMETTTQDITELVLTDAFIGGAAQVPRVMVYNAETGLTALEITDGSVVWTLAPEDCALGASISHAVNGEGTMYIGGYYGPDPVAIAADGTVLWTALLDSNDIFWLYDMELQDETLAAHYDYLGDANSGWVIYDITDGSVIGIEYDE